MRRLRAASVLILTAFFAAAGAYHHHDLPRVTHDHAGLCSEAGAGPSLESCAICQATQNAAHQLAAVASECDFDRSSPLEALRRVAPIRRDPSLPHDPRAPPAA